MYIPENACYDDKLKLYTSYLKPYKLCLYRDGYIILVILHFLLGSLYICVLCYNKKITKKVIKIQDINEENIMIGYSNTKYVIVVNP
jgi:hypothetical protein